MTADEQQLSVPLSEYSPVRSAATRPAGLVVICLGWPLSLLLLFAGYHRLLRAAGVSGTALVTVLVLFIPFAVFLSIGAHTWFLGALALALRRPANGLTWHVVQSPTELTVRSAIVVPIKNEDTAEVFGNIAAMRESLRDAGAEHLFDIYVVSNSDDPNCWVEEELAWQHVADSAEGLYYWRRHRKKGKKPANIAEFCERWGSRYEYMVILDADSLMTAECMLALVGLMEHNPRAGIMQTATDYVKGRTLWARLQQFTIFSNTRIIQWGERVWQGGACPYIGHNAIIRIAPFMQHCGLPTLPGKPPFGGELLSHDFVEAALLTRAGWQVWLVPELAGSYEECPATLPEYFRRDRRWFQGDFVNLRLLWTPKLALISRIRFATAALRDMSPPVLLVLSAVIIGSAHAPGYAAGAVVLPLLAWDFATRQSWAGVPAVGFGISIRSTTPRRTPLLAALGNGILDQLIWLFNTPNRVLTHALYVVEIAAGRDIGWTTSRRSVNTALSHGTRRIYLCHTLFGIAAALLLIATDSWATWWLAPILICWICTIPIAQVFDSCRVGALARRAGILRTPEEYETPRIIARSEELARTLRQQLPVSAWQTVLHEDSAIAVHRAFLAHSAPLTPDERTEAAAAAEKYLGDRTAATLTETEKFALLRDPYRLWHNNPPSALAIRFPDPVPMPMPVQQLTRN
ncbi:glucans biosynthesis glucosyltransferase MdoH [Nocardia sp. CA-128927]|uniref:glucans biosynthesis glucosyltransferase MdoH n=1 Tax=Nocardia sp. CA-128927 TaxID=3239975 RepID=UPI003D97DD80